MSHPWNDHDKFILSPPRPRSAGRPEPAAEALEKMGLIETPRSADPGFRFSLLRPIKRFFALAPQRTR